MMASALAVAWVATYGVGLVGAATLPQTSPESTHPVATRHDAARHRSLEPFTPAPPLTAAAVVPAVKREVFGFALASSLSDPTIGDSTWDFSLLSTVAFFGLHVQNDGTFTADSGQSVWNSSQLTDLITMAHAHGTKVVVTIIEQDFSSGTPNMCAALSHYSTTVTNTVSEVAAKGVDGVNVDYEGLNGSCGTADASWTRHTLTSFVAALRAALPAGSYLSIDTYASSAADSLGFFDIPNLAKSVDSFFVMAYDLEYSNWSRAPVNCSSFCLGPTSPLTGYFYNSTTTAGQYTAVVPASQVILGVPYYGRKSCVASAAPNSYPTGPVSADSYIDAVGESSSSLVGFSSYAVHRDANDPTGQERWDTWFNTSLGCTRELYWDDVVSLSHKYALVNSDALRGVGIWNLNYGGSSPELWCQLSTSFVGAGSHAPAVASLSPGTGNVSGGTSVTITGCGFSGATAVNFGTTAAARFSVNSDGQITATTPASGSGVVDVTVTTTAGTSTTVSQDHFQFITAGTCTAVTASASPASPSRAGTMVTITGSATCPNANPAYEFWMRPASQTAWQLVQGYSTSSTYNWNSTGAAPGIVYFGVWVHDISSSAPYDVYTTLTYTVLGPECQSVTISSAPASPQMAGTKVVFTAVASGCQDANPRYEFWMRPASASTWQLVQGYSTSPTYDWNSTGAAAGTVYFGVWAKDAASPNPSDAVASTPYMVTTPSCTSVTVSAAPSSVTHGSGTHVAITASASGCTDPNPQYEFWMRTTTTGWQLVQAYSTGAGYDWNSTGAPVTTVYFGVWVKDANSPTSSFDANASTTVGVT
jgi:spore germination protein YaaH